MVAGCIRCHLCLWSVRSPFPKQEAQATSTSREKGFFRCMVALSIAVGQCEAGVMEKSVCAPHCSLLKGLGPLPGPIFSHPHPLLIKVSHLPTVPQMEIKPSTHDLVGPQNVMKVRNMTTYLCWYVWVVWPLAGYYTSIFTNTFYWVVKSYKYGVYLKHKDGKTWSKNEKHWLGSLHWPWELPDLWHVEYYLHRLVKLRATCWF